MSSPHTGVRIHIPLLALMLALICASGLCAGLRAHRRPRCVPHRDSRCHRAGDQRFFPESRWRPPNSRTRSCSSCSWILPVGWKQPCAT